MTQDKLQSHESNLQKAKTSLYQVRKRYACVRADLCLLLAVQQSVFGLQRIGELVEQVPFLIKSQLESLVAFQVSPDRPHAHDSLTH